MATPTSADRQRYALQTIFSFFLGLMVLAFVGVGVNTFYPSPQDKRQTQQDDIQRQIDAVNVAANGSSLDATQKAQMDKLTAAQNALQRDIQAEMKIWARNTSIILVLFATVVMGVSLLLSEQLRVLSNGLLLGGLFTMLYGTGWVIFSGNSAARFFVIAFALVVSIALGYLKFVRERGTTPVSPETGASGANLDDAALSGLAARVEALEQRSSAAAAALAGEKHEG